MIDRIGHINIRTTMKHFEDTLEFYERLMGLKRAEGMAMPDPNNIWLFADNGRAIVHVNAIEEGGDVEPDGVSTGRINHVAFDCRDYDLAISRLKEMNLDYERYETAVKDLVLLVTKDSYNNIIIELSFGADTVVRPDLQKAV
ncbi:MULTISPECIES: VOC family protein [unclassified Sphingomonas]|uniref:VOC family protein n=1 Tax=unclassified Sphingomonas TaxID=196159 RepID=UPI000AAA6C21|nr:MULTISPECIES: VOC family protein [unclassified Sphingomonas]